MRKKIDDLDKALQSEAFCLMPWIHLHVGYAGKVKACCVANITYGNINDQPLETIWNSPSARSFRLKMLQDEKDNRCQYCYTTEAAGKESIRTETLKKFSNHLPNTLSTDATGKVASVTPVYWDIRFSNLCNFRCRTCWHGASSKWFKEAKVIGNTAGEVALIENIDSFELLQDRLKAYLLEVEEVYFAGGEPLFTPEHYQLLQWMQDNHLDQVQLRYNTNLSVVDHKGLDLIKMWNQFKKVEVLMSIDATNSRGEYIRKDMSWAVIEKNMETIKLKAPHVRLVLAPTVSVFNIYVLPEMYERFIKMGWIQRGDLYINFLEQPKAYNCKVLPKEFKNAVDKLYTAYLKQLKEQRRVDEINLWSSIRSFLHQEDFSRHLLKMKQMTRQLDQLRGEVFEEVFTEYKNLFKGL